MMSNNRLPEFLDMLRRTIVMMQLQHCKEKLDFVPACEDCRFSRCYREVFRFSQPVDMTEKRPDTGTRMGFLASVDALRPQPIGW
jgi:hypothetical protein